MGQYEKVYYFYNWREENECETEKGVEEIRADNVPIFAKDINLNKDSGWSATLNKQKNSKKKNLCPDPS
jgi:hypothetical protein